MLISPITTHNHNHGTIILWTIQANLYKVSRSTRYVTIWSPHVTFSLVIGLLTSVSSKARPLIISDHGYGDVVVMGQSEAVVKTKVLKLLGNNRFLGVSFEDWYKKNCKNKQTNKQINKQNKFSSRKERYDPTVYMEAGDTRYAVDEINRLTEVS